MRWRHLLTLSCSCWGVCATRCAPLVHPLSKALFELVSALALDSRPCGFQFWVCNPPTERVAVKIAQGFPPRLTPSRPGDANLTGKSSVSCLDLVCICVNALYLRTAGAEAVRGAEELPGTRCHCSFRASPAHQMGAHHAGSFTHEQLSTLDLSGG